MSNDITPERLKSWRKAEGLNQTELGQMLGWDKIIVSSIETGRRQISAPEQRLLKLLILGEPPFLMEDDPWNPQVDFTQEEWSIMTRIAHREGYHSPRAWIVQKIRDCLAMRREYPQQSAQFEQIPAEDPSPYGKKPNGDVDHSG